ncbi:hypothetical protein [Nonomuraea jabiensis]|uniref:Uncharacterized protein n=1 Tax=Nonomuraea jabiensis TaxID=882448 RepID=A0A7W9G326_9ACTN|nr:hypothetical protein [Nonomuraea jabiensis]MBB5776242.1 hypothetical protein [Nonomuraea jabiensis]
MTAEAIGHPAEPVMLSRADARSLADVVRRLVAASSGIMGGGRQLGAEEYAALRRCNAQLVTLIYNFDGGEVIDLDRERARRR